MNHILHALSLLLLHGLIFTSAASDPPLPPPPPSVSCFGDLVNFSFCLPYVADSPNNLTNTPPPQCCDDVSSAFSAGTAVCFCYFVQRPNILGFPINSAKLMSLTSVCPMSDVRSSSNFSIETLCSGSAVLPPLESITGPTALPPVLSITGPNNSKPPNSGVHSPPTPSADSREPTPGLLNPEPADELPAQPSLPTIPLRTSSATRIYQVSCTLLILALYIFTSA